MRRSVSSPFCEMFRRHLAASGKSLREFSRLSGFSSAYVSHVQSGQRLPPLDALGSWADVLGIQGAERETFILEGGLAHAPLPIQTLARELMAMRDRLQERIAAFDQVEAENSLLRSQVAILREQLAGRA